jgi:3-hydroxyisobutyrate dehydrogenase-like beta-hydroxyacid dehydrogenase
MMTSGGKTVKVGFIGIGNMGSLMARHILEAGYNLYVHDIRKEAAKPLLDKGATWLDTPKAMAQACEVILSSLPGPPEVEQVALGKNGLFSGWKKGDIYVDTSTNSPTTMRKVAEKARSIGVEVLDAPVSGGMPGAEAGTLTIMVGGSVTALEKVRSILLAIGKNIFHVGDSGCGDIAKLVNNTISISCTSINAEAFVLGVKAGIDASTLLEILKVSTGFNRAQEQYPRSVLKGDFEPRFKLSLACKDLKLALGLAKEYNVSMPVVDSACSQQFFKAEASGLGEKDHQSVILQLEKAAGVQVRASK